MRTVEQVRKRLQEILDDIEDCRAMYCSSEEELEYENEEFDIKEMSQIDDDKLIDFIKDMAEKDDSDSNLRTNYKELWKWITHVKTPHEIREYIQAWDVMGSLEHEDNMLVLSLHDNTMISDIKTQAEMQKERVAKGEDVTGLDFVKLLEWINI